MAEQDPAPASRKRTDPTSQLARGELLHAEVKPLDLSGVPTVLAGTALWAVAFVVVLIFHDELKRDGDEWWLWVTVTGFGLGWIGLAYCQRRWKAVSSGRRPAYED